MSVSSLKFFEIHISLAKLYVLPRTVRLFFLGGGGKNCCSECLNIRKDFCSSIFIFRNCGSVCSEDRAKEEKILVWINIPNFFSGMIWNYLNAESLPYFCGISPNFLGEMPRHSTCRTEWRTWRLHGVKTRPATLNTSNVSWLHSYIDWN